MQMLRKLLLLASLVCLAKCGINNIPGYNPTEKVIDCTDGNSAADTCDVMLVVESLVTMTYFNISKDFREYRSYRFAFDSTGDIRYIRNRGLDTSKLVPPIQTDGHFRSIITINAQMPGPTIIAHYNQTLNIKVFNELRNGEGTAIHWHGIHQIGTPEADGVSHITQNPILPHNSYTYTFQATPAGTHWYHAHSGLQRTDGLYGALIVKDTLPGNVYDNDYPEQHTLLLMDWQREPSLDVYFKQHLDTGAGVFKEIPINDAPYIEYERYSFTFSPDGFVVSLIPFWSGIINDKGRFYNENGQPNIVNPSCNNLNCFNVTWGGKYRFRLIGAMFYFIYRFSIEGHSLTVVASDGSPIKSIENVDYLIISPGERYDVVVHANNTERRNFWIWAETIESAGRVFYNPVNKHRAEAILHYNEYNVTDIAEINETKSCNSSSRCKAVNCPFKQYSNIMKCINAEQFESLPSVSIPSSIHSPNVTLFYSISFIGPGHHVDGINFRLPANPPLTEHAKYQNSNDKCPRRGCDLDREPLCSCTQEIDIGDLPRDSVVEIIIVNRNTRRNNRFGAPHPMHLHGHYFYVAEIGYGEYNENGLYINATDDVECIVKSNNQTCPNHFTTVEDDNGNFKQEVRWKNMNVINTQNKALPRKDTLTVPYGGYAVIRFVVDNPGWWLFHCHIQSDQTDGMAVVIAELLDELTDPNDLNPPNNSCMPAECEPCMPASSYNVRGSLLMIIYIIIFISVVLF